MTVRRWLAAIVLVAACGPAVAAEPPSFGECDRQVREAPRQVESYRCYLRAATYPGGMSEAMRRVQAILAIEPDNPYAGMIAAALHANAGSGDPGGMYADAIRELEARGDETTEIRARSLQISFFLARGDVPAAWTAISEIRSRADTLGSTPARHVADLADAYLASIQGHYDRAHEILVTIEPDILQNGELPALSRWLTQMGYVYWATGRPAEAARCYERRLAVIARTGEEYEEPSIRYNLALMTSFATATPPGPAERDALRVLYTQALDLARRYGNRSIELKARIDLANIDAADARAARAHLEQALGLAMELGSLDSYLLALRSLGWNLVLYEPRDVGRALEIADEAIARAVASGNGFQEARGRFSRAVWRSDRAHVAAWRGAERVAALDAFEESLAAVERIRERQRDDEIRARTFGTWAFVYRRYVEEVLRGFERSGDPEDLAIAFRTAERMHARELLDELDAAGAESAVASAIPSIDDIRNALRPGEILLGYQLGADQMITRPSFLIAHTRDGSRVYDMPPWSDLRARIDVFTGMLRAGEDPVAAAAALYRTLVEPAVLDANESPAHFIVIADGPLHRLPFSALRPDEDEPPIGATHHVSVVPSATAWLRMRTRSNDSDRTVVFADPVESSIKAAGSRASDRTWGSLPWARAEARSIAGVLEDVVVRNGRSATPDSVRADAAAGRIGILHFATHARTDWDHPDRSAVILAPGATGDGHLRVADIVGLDLDGAVVVLSACGSASGTALDGEGPMSLARAFFVAGARTVVATLWPLRDRDARAFFEPFYQAIAEGDSVAAAATRARRAAISAGLPASAWAGIVVAGDGAAVPVPGGDKRDRPPIWPWVVAGMAIVGAVIVASRRRS